ncbi:MAG: hypothetical protein LBI57_02190 [Helicobacteraceae bacterium]|jgi:hypothetical protein|nr:hypothetical protein [Helicobacteraceae bacterium]
MEMSPQIQAYFEAKDGDANLIANYFADNICIDDTGENDVIKGFDNCKKWLEDKSKQYQMKTKIVDIKNEENGTIKVSVIVTGSFAPGNYPFDYYFSIVNGKIEAIKIIYMGE